MTVITCTDGGAPHVAVSRAVYELHYCIHQQSRLLPAVTPAGYSLHAYPWRGLVMKYWPSSLHEPAPGPMIDPAVRIILTEGNYLLLDQPPWNGLAKVLDGCWFIVTPLAQAREWTIARHIAGGRTPDDAKRHYERNDLPNAQLVLAGQRAPDAVIRSERRA